MQSVVPMVDLVGQLSEIRAEIDKAIANVLDTTAFIKGPQVSEFESALAKYLEVKHVTACANGTDALQIALMALDLPKGSEIITPDFTFVATAEVVRLLGFTPVIVDIDPDTFNISPEKIRQAISDKTRAIIPVHLFGQCADMESIMAIASEFNLYVIEDNAQAIGADYIFSNGGKKKAGTIGHIGCTSFFPSKNLGCYGDGGSLFTNDTALGKKIQTIANHGMSEQYLYETIGVNSRLDSVQAAILNVKLKRLDAYNNARQAAAAFYDEAFKDNDSIITPARSPFSTHIFHQYTIRVKATERQELSRRLSSKGISNKIYYPQPIHEYKPYATGCRFDVTMLANSITASETVLSLPIHTELNEETLIYITNNVNEFFKINV